MAEHLELVAEIPKIEKLTVQERLEYAKKRRAQQLKRWEREEDTLSGPSPPKKKPMRAKPVNFPPSTILLEAATRGDLEEVRALLDGGMDPNLANDDGLTGLHQACIDGSEDMIDLFLEYGANLDATDREFWTPLHAATACGNADIVEYLIEEGANIVAINSDSNMPIDLVGEDDDELKEILEAEMEEQGYSEEKLEELRDLVERRMLAEVKDAVANEVDLDMVVTDQGATFMHIAVANGYEDVTEFLLEQGAAVDYKDKDGWQPIHGAAVWGNEQVIQMLVEAGADLEAKTPTGDTPLTLCEDPELQRFIVDLKNKVKANKVKTGKRKRSNSRSLSVKRTSLKDKITISQNEAKAEAVLRVHPQLAFLIPSEERKKLAGTTAETKPTDVTPTSTTAAPTENSTTHSDIREKATTGIPTQNSTTSSEKRDKNDHVTDHVIRVGPASGTRNKDSEVPKKDSPSRVSGKDHVSRTRDRDSPGRTRKSPRTDTESPRKGTESPRKTTEIYRKDTDSPRKTTEITRKDTDSPQKDIESPREPKDSHRKDTENPRKDTESPQKVRESPSQGREKENINPNQGERSVSTAHSKHIDTKDTDTNKPDVRQSGTSSYTRSDAIDKSKPLEERPMDNQKDHIAKVPEGGKNRPSDTRGPGYKGPTQPVAPSNAVQRPTAQPATKLGPHIESSGTSSLPRSIKSRPAPAPPLPPSSGSLGRLPHSSGSLSRNFEKSDTSGYPDSFSKKSRGSRENIMDVAATGRLARPDPQAVSVSDVKIQSAGTNKPNRTVDRTQPSTGGGPYQPHNKPANAGSNSGQRTAGSNTGQRTVVANIGQRTAGSNTGQRIAGVNSGQRPNNEGKREDGNKNATRVANERIHVQDDLNVVREKKSCCVVM